MGFGRLPVRSPQNRCDNGKRKSLFVSGSPRSESVSSCSALATHTCYPLWVPRELRFSFPPTQNSVKLPIYIERRVKHTESVPLLPITF